MRTTKNAVLRFCCRLVKDKETDKAFEKVLIPNKYTRESRLWLLLAREGDN